MARVTYRGRLVDPVALWGDYVDWPSSFQGHEDEDYAPLVVCPNPQHDTMKRHFQVNLTKPLVHCFAGCGISGTYEHAISMIEGVTEREARKRVLRHSRVGTQSRKRKSAKPVSALDNSYERFIPQAPMEYLTRRGFTAATIARFEFGWDADTLRIVIPAKDTHGRLKFLIRRTIKPNVEPRYLYPEGSAKNSLLYGACFIDLGMVRSQGIVLVEGSLDTAWMHQLGFTNTVGILGSKLSEIQAKMIDRMRPAQVFTMYDADGAGIEATISTAKRIRRVPIRVCRYPKGRTDPQELSKEEAIRVLSRTISFSKFSKVVRQAA